MIILKSNICKALILHHTTDTDNTFRAMHLRFVKLKTLLNDAFKMILLKSRRHISDTLRHGDGTAKSFYPVYLLSLLSCQSAS